MRKRRGARRSPRRAAGRPPRATRSIQAYLLDQFSSRDLGEWARQRDDVLSFHWAFYTALLDQRTRVRSAITQALSEAVTGPIEIERWHRVVPYEFSLEPLSAAGSIKSANGGRFNLGGIDPLKFPQFPALYVAQDRETALAEKFGVARQEAGEFTALDLALRTEGATSLVLVRGRLETAIDLRRMERLEPFVNVIAGFKIPDELVRRARRGGVTGPLIVTSTDSLSRALLDPDWRKFPAMFDVPATPQIFGQEVRAAGIEGILYPSSKTDTLCAAIFPDMLGPQSFVELVGPTPPGVATRLDGTNWKEFV